MKMKNLIPLSSPQEIEDQLKEESCLIVGGAGFLGGYLVPIAARQFKTVHVIDPERVSCTLLHEERKT